MTLLFGSSVLITALHLIKKIIFGDKCFLDIKFDIYVVKGGLDMVGAMAVLNIGSWETFAAKVKD